MVSIRAPEYELPAIAENNKVKYTKYSESDFTWIFPWQVGLAGINSDGIEMSYRMHVFTLEFINQAPNKRIG